MPKVAPGKVVRHHMVSGGINPHIPHGQLNHFISVRHNYQRQFPRGARESGECKDNVNKRVLRSCAERSSTRARLTPERGLASLAGHTLL